MIAFEKSCGLISLLDEDEDDDVAVFGCDVLIVEFVGVVALSPDEAVAELLLVVVLFAVD
jgi:hypothetical protein